MFSLVAAWQRNDASNATDDARCRQDIMKLLYIIAAYRDESASDVSAIKAANSHEAPNDDDGDVTDSDSVD